MPRSESSIGRELLWLLIFLALFAAVAVLLLTLVVPHHFNDRIAILIAAIIAGVVWIGLRSYADRSRRA